MANLEADIKTLGYPLKDELEITTLGIGGFSGEAIVVHFGDDEWGLIDSCKSKDGIIMPLFYLKHLGVDYKKVKVVICTHWHEDHIKGLSEILKKCDEAKFYFPIVGQNNNLLKYLIEGDAAQGRGVWAEFINSLGEAGEKRCEWSNAGKLLVESGNASQLFALSPSDKMLEEMERILVRFDKKDADKSKIGSSVLPANLCSTALLLRTSICDVLLGGDLESNRNSQDDIVSCLGKCPEKWEKGWCHVIEKSTPFNGRKVSYIKLPHHSSETGYCQRIWDEHAEAEVTAVSTVFVNNAGTVLPQQEMLKKYHGLTKELFMTSSGPKSPKGAEKGIIDKNNAKGIKSLIAYPEEKGIVCSRRKQGEAWKTTCLGTAILVSDGFVKKYKV